MGLCGAGHHALNPNARGGFQIHGGVQRPSLYQPQGIEVQILLPTESKYRSCQGRHNAVKLQEKCFYSHTEETEQGQLQ